VIYTKESEPMQILCYHCHKPYAIGREAVHQALDILTTSGMGHYDAPCPHCKRVNRVSKQELLRAAPDWKEVTTQENAPEE
jgi:phage FluMu protein Com